MEGLNHSISFASKDLEMPFDDSLPYVDWLLDVIKAESKTLDKISYLFCNDEMILEINKQHLNHDYYTDIITFPYSYDPIESDIIISLERVRENAIELNVSAEEELRRVIVHGLLHMCGYDDSNEASQAIMREKENHYLSIFR